MTLKIFKLLLSFVVLCSVLNIIFICRSFRIYSGIAFTPIRLSDYGKINTLHMTMNNKWKANKRTSSKSQKFAGRNGNLQEKKTKAFEPLAGGERVQRIINKQNRYELSDLIVGQKVKGHIISLTDFGMFVDIGTTRDGLVHVKDMSKDYFVKDHRLKYAPGQDIDVWIKFVDPELNKLGLQLFPISLSPIHRNEMVLSKLDASALSEGDKVQGIVVRASEYGVYVDIGVGFETFLQKRKMKIGRLRIKLKPWEIFPIGTRVEGFIYQLQSNRIALTTFLPEEWEDKIPVKESDDSDDDEDEEVGGTTRADNFRSKRSSLLLDNEKEEDFDEDDDEDSSLEDIGEDDEDYDGGVVEELSPTEIERIVAERQSKQSEVLSSNDNESISDIINEVEGEVESDELGIELNTEELFTELSKGKEFVILKDIKRWDYIVDLIKDGDLDESTLLDVFRKAGRGVSGGKLNIDQFDDFIDCLADHLGLDDDTSSDVLFDDSEEDDVSSGRNSNYQETELLMDESSSVDGNFIGNFEADDKIDDDIEEFEVSGGSDVLSKEIDEENNAGEDDDSNSDSADELSLEDHYARKSKTNDLFQYVFNSVAGKKGYIVIDDVTQWDFVKALIENDAISQEEINDLFRQANQKVDRTNKNSKQKLTTSQLDKAAFESFVEALSKREISLQKSKSSLSPSINSSPANKDIIPVASSIDSKLGYEDDDENDDDIDVDDGDDDEYLRLVECFNELSNGEDTVSLEVIKSWDAIQDMIDDDLMSVTDLRAYFIQAGGIQNQIKSKPKKTKGKKKIEAESIDPDDDSNLTIDLDGFERLLDLLTPIIEETELDESSTSINIIDSTDGLDDLNKVDDGNIRIKSVDQPLSMMELKADRQTDLFNAISTDFIPTSASAFLSEFHSIDIPQEEAVTQISDPANSVNGEISSDSEYAGEDDIEDAKLLRSVFIGIANGKSYVSLKDLLNWDFVLDLIMEGEITEDSLAEKMLQYGGNQKGLDIEGFDKLVDDLVNSYKECFGEEDADEEDDEDEDEKPEVSTPEKIELIEEDLKDIFADQKLNRKKLNQESLLLGSSDLDISLAVGTNSETDNQVLGLDEDMIIDEGYDDTESDGDVIKIDFNKLVESGFDEITGEEGDYYDIDTETSFNEVAKGKDTINFEDLKQWELIQDLYEGEHMNDAKLLQLLQLADIEDVNRITIDDFEVFLSELSGDEDDEDDDDDDDIEVEDT